MQILLRFLVLLFLSLLPSPPTGDGPVAADERLITYGIEYQDRLCGYSQFRVTDMRDDGRDLVVLRQKMYVMLSLLGAEFNSELDLTYHVERATGRFVYHDSRIRQGDFDARMAMFIEGGNAHFTLPDEDEDTVVPVPATALLPNTLFFPHLHRDFVVGDLAEKTYDVFEVRDGEVHEVRYRRLEDEPLVLSGTEYDTVALLEEDLRTGVRIRRWLNRENGHVLKTVQPNGMVITLADESVVDNIEMANVDDSILVRTNERIRDYPRLRYMRVRAVLEPTGLRPTPESLNVPGQSFEGTVEGNRIEGVFEISHPVYDGADAPPFPPAWGERADLAPFLGPEEFIEADDPVLVAAAREMVDGATDSWDAACRIARWVAVNIHGALPGGVTARRTYDVRAGECGAHSFLTAALCRAVGIPARTVWGCMYFPLHGGTFGQHAWNEVYMGEAGWIPLDTTARQPDFVDSGHVRVGIFQSKTTALNGESFEILDHLLADD